MTRAVRMNALERETYARGRQHFERGDVDTAVQAFERLLEDRDDFADVHYMMGVLLDRKGETEAAAESLRRAIRLNPSYTEALLALASISEGRGEFSRSRELVERASQSSRRDSGPLDATTRGKLANLQAAVADAYIESGEASEAVEGYRKALDLCPRFHDIRHRLGLALREAGLPDRAVREFQRVLRADPEFLDARVQLGLTYYTLGRTEDALEEWRGVLENDPSREDAQMYLRLLRAGDGSP